MNKKKLPIGIQTFAKIREENCYYVDKTPLIEKLVTQGSHYFLSRPPRRFGKSLLVDAIGEWFAGNQTLFEGLYIYDRWDWSVEYPVIRISFGGSVIESRADLEIKIQEQLRINEANLHKPETTKEIRDGLRNLYSVIKDSNAHVKFAMLTGVSKFSKFSLFSGLNNLDDITDDAPYSAICGYTDEDIDTVFAPELDGLVDRE